ncbi:hypothetical protein [Stenotrophomonas sp. PD6]|uniref:hypothetical protein n=1 Tax=Stenotrophomonas sp. PD6 TaxID=3368612 RepID=UPI003B9E0840
MANRLYVTEGALHLHSSDPIVLTPGDLRHADQRPEVRDLLQGCNLYLIASRARIYVDHAHLDNGTLYGTFNLAQHEERFAAPFACPLPRDITVPPSELIAGTSLSGTHVVLKQDQPDGGSFIFPVNALIARSTSPLPIEACDMEVLYVGQGMGRTRARTAVDRLRRHETFQTILAEHHTFHPEREILLLLYRFEHQRNFLSTGGDFSLQPQASQDQERQHLQKIATAVLSRKERIALAEAALINHFKPHYNAIFKGTDFTRASKLKTLRAVLRQDLTGLMVEINTSSVKGRLGSAHRPHGDNPTLDMLNENIEARRAEGIDPELYAEMLAELSLIRHAHFANFALTSPHERETFLHDLNFHWETG